MAASGCICTFVPLLLRTCFQSIALGGHGTVPVIARKAPRAAEEPAEAGLTCLLLFLSQITSWDSRAIISRSRISLNTSPTQPRSLLLPQISAGGPLGTDSCIDSEFQFSAGPPLGLHLYSQGEEVLLSELLFCARK